MKIKYNIKRGYVNIVEKNSLGKNNQDSKIKFYKYLSKLQLFFFQFLFMFFFLLF